MLCMSTRTATIMAQRSMRDESLECRFTSCEVGIYDLISSHLLTCPYHSPSDCNTTTHLHLQPV